MNIAEMHVWFRQYAQQMGMQNTRAILPEQIDLLINTSITDTINQIIRENIGVTNDRVITDNSRIGQINAFRTLYKVKEIEIVPKATYEKVTISNYPNESNKEVCIIINDVKYFVTVSDYTNVRQTTVLFQKIKNIEGVNLTYGYEPDESQGRVTIITENQGPIYKIAIGIGSTKQEAEANASLSENYVEAKLFTKYIPFVFNKRNRNIGLLSGITDEDGTVFPKFLFLVDFALNYKASTQGFDDNGFNYQYEDEALETNYFPVRLIDDAFLADTLNDFVLAPRLRTPIIVSYNNKYDLYISKFIKNKDNDFSLENNLLPYKLRMSYVAQPAKVRYSEDILGDNVDCDLPPSMHVDILKHAVDLYRIAVSGSLQASQQQNEAQQREDVRNNYRNEGNQRQQQ